jgi:DNA modification methylase
MNLNTATNIEKPPIPLVRSNALLADFINNVHCMDNLAGMAELPEKCANLIIADPPYFEVKGDFDFIWKSFDEYLEFMELQAKAYKRILAENGTFFVYGHSKKIAYVQVIFDKYFGLVNNLVWEKAERDGLFGATGSEQLRSFPNATERVLMYSNEVLRTGLEEIKLDVNNFKDLRNYFKAMQGWLGLNIKKINTRLGHRKAEHSFYHSSTQWQLGTPEVYQELVDCFGIDTWVGFRQYEDLRREYEDLRRPFSNVTKSTEVLKFRFKSTSHDHDTVKPDSICNMLVNTCSRKGDLVVVPFAGSGSECVAAKKNGRDFIGFDVEQKYVDMAKNRVRKETAQLRLF